MRPRLPRPTYANVAATLALFVALGGTGYAASTIGTSQIANSAVTTAKIKNAAVTSPKLANNAVASARIASNAVTGAKIASNAVGTAKIANAAVTTAKIAAGAVTASQLAPATLAALQGGVGPAGAGGPAGPAGPPGPAGAKGDTGPSDTYTNSSGFGTIAANAGPTLVTGRGAPPGNYLFQANVVLTNTAGAKATITCQIVAPGGHTVDTATTTLDAAGGLDTQTLALAGTDATVAYVSYLMCGTSGSAPVNYIDADIMATRVGTLQ